MAGLAGASPWRVGLRTIPLGLGGMLGAGVFAGIAPAAGTAGRWTLIAVPLAALTAWCAVVSTSHQSASYRGAGAAYSCVRDKLGILPGRVAAGTGLFGHVAAMAAIAGAVAEYLPAPDPVTTAAVLLLVVLVSAAGLRIRGLSGWLWLGLTLAVLTVVVTACLSIAPVPVSTGIEHGPLAITSSAGFFFFAFLGFERLTAPDTERDRHPRAAVRRGALFGVAATAVVLLVVSFAVLHQLGAARLGLSPVPLLDALRAADAATLTSGVGLGAALAMTPVLLGALESGRSTGLAVISDGELPASLGRRGGSGTPYLFDLVLAAAAVVLALLVSPAVAMGAAACCLLVHYAFVNAAARVLLLDEWTWSTRTACLGMGLSVILAMSMPVPAMLFTLGAVLVLPVCAGLADRAGAATRG
ncbi:amino acid permease [Actinopolyspora saharensis]|uniref:Basic amino acid/polyamine antiporter, APA family n=1 Tax=Actinopolyspora saharensis TaxID=995062 RepID=A0A1H0XUE2_9ACTN|nr:amino acid permease [Actinopolyspora saharensis]SDQ06534.1 basic amino acid/polyamine antiporter, APA family [Actinopolyspora saharensis]